MIKIIAVGNIKEKYLKEAIEEYKKRISKYSNLEIIEVKDESYDDIKKVLEVESEKIEKHLSDKDYIITLEIEGKEYSSENEDTFTAFKMLKDDLLSGGYKMCCAGAMENAVQSGMMAGSDRVYLIKEGEKPKPSDAVGMFDYME